MAEMTPLLIGVGVTAASHPMGYVKVLIQCGHEPLPPQIGRNIFGRSQMQLPGLFAYIKHIKSVDGFLGLYRGFFPRLCSGLTGSLVSSHVQEQLSDPNEDDSTKKNKFKNKSLQAMMEQSAKDTAARFAAILASQPFHVITVRCMVQFVGRETKYNSLFGSIREIYNEEGILGFFAGLIPRLLGEVASLWLANTLMYIINAYILDEEMSNVNELRSYSMAVTGFFSNMICYPFALVGNIMAINNCGLAAGEPPKTLVYADWRECWRWLSKEGQLKRGSSLFWRPYRSPAQYY
ncbi:mitochondrial carrier homolog 2-like [Saccoglossus kowalevskii]|uniref:Mitochondrial carrier homolog 2-like n=1 Tax=Saccoglossus kowalevskii TaxID=10224 RepID=A0ABM0GYY8_SACKO|nr:PREDICTED: mitochondrial carrier homolog 2-like [Saccoglossus kowalevskii]